MRNIIILVIVFLISVYLHNFGIRKSVENFTALKGIEMPLTTYDDYATFGYIHHTNDLPKHDNTYDMLACKYEKEKGNYLRNRSYTPYNYSQNQQYSNNDFDIRRHVILASQNKHNPRPAGGHVMIDPIRPRTSLQTPLPNNYYLPN